MSTLLVEDDGATRAYLLDALNRISALQPVNFAVDVASGMRALERFRPKLLLVDLGLPDGEGTQLIAMAAKMEPRPEVLVISSLGDESHVVRALEAGASGYLLKDETPEAIGVAALKVLDGESPISPAIAVHLLKRFRPATHGRAARIHKRRNHVTLIVENKVPLERDLASKEAVAEG